MTNIDSRKFNKKSEPLQDKNTYVLNKEQVQDKNTYVLNKEQGCMGMDHLTMIYINFKKMKNIFFIHKLIVIQI
jgi:hypothetical protein